MFGHWIKCTYFCLPRSLYLSLFLSLPLSLCVPLSSPDDSCHTLAPVALSVSLSFHGCDVGVWVLLISLWASSSLLPDTKKYETWPPPQLTPLPTPWHTQLRYQCSFDSFDVLEPLSIFLIGNSFETLNQVSPHKYISSANYWTPLFNFLKLITPPFLSNHQVHGSPFVLQLLGCDLVEGLAQLTVWYEKRWSR